jgi:hypothetical protein
MNVSGRSGAFVPEKLTLIAYVGEDELGSGVVGIKGAHVPAGYIPLVAIESHRDRLDNTEVIRQLQMQADKYGKVIRLARFEFVEDVIVLKPRPRG